MTESSNRFDQHPYMVVWETTRACALACRHCRAEAQSRPAPGELSTDDAKRFFEHVHRAQPKLFILTGGDPSRRDDILELIQSAAQTGCRIGFSPSATPHLLKMDFNALRQAGVSAMSLSLDGADQPTHEQFRGVKGTWPWTLEAVENARSAGIRLQINTTLTPANAHQLEAFRPVLEQIEPMTWSLFLLVQTGRGRGEALLSAGEIETFFRSLYHFSKTVPYKIKTTEGQHYRRVKFQLSGGADQETLGLNNGRGFVFVSHTGEIFPSGFLPLLTGNVKEDDLLETYRHHPVFRDLRDSAKLKGKCGRCEFNAVCGGSRARAYAMTGDALASEPLCVYQPQASSVEVSCFNKFNF